MGCTGSKTQEASLPPPPPPLSHVPTIRNQPPHAFGELTLAHAPLVHTEKDTISNVRFQSNRSTIIFYKRWSDLPRAATPRREQRAKQRLKPRAQGGARLASWPAARGGLVQAPHHRRERREKRWRPWPHGRGSEFQLGHHCGHNANCWVKSTGCFSVTRNGKNKRAASSTQVRDSTRDGSVFPWERTTSRKTPEPPLLPRGMAGERRGGRAPGPVWPDGLPVPVHAAGRKLWSSPSLRLHRQQLDAWSRGDVGRSHRTWGEDTRHQGRRWETRPPRHKGQPATSVQRHGRPRCERQSWRTLGKRRSRDTGGPGVRGKVGGPSGIQSSAEAALK